MELTPSHRGGSGPPLVCPGRIVWGTEDADWVVLDGAGHGPQLDVPVEAAELSLTYGGS